MENLQPERLGILDFFKRVPDAQFVIPVYQRNYIWKANKQVKKYLEDFNNILNGSKSGHFIGVMMYLKIQKHIGVSEYSIVDGQQRLVTTFLILQVLKEIALENGDDRNANAIEDMYLTNRFVDDPSDKLKLKPLISDDEVYSKIISKEKITKAEERSKVYQSYKFIKSYLKERYGKYSIEKILDALNALCLIMVPLGGEDNAQEIFETINSAGAELTKSDLIRNFILMNIESKKQDELYNKYWKPLEAIFEQTGKMENFFRMFLANRTYELPNVEEIYEVFQKWFNKQISENKKRDDILKQILRYAEYYSNLFISSDFNIEKEIKIQLDEFRKSTIEPTAPLLMEIYNLYESKNPSNERLVSKENFAKIIKLLNTYNIRRNICNLRTGVLTRIIPPMLRDIMSSCKNDYTDIYKYLVQLLVDNNRDKASFMPDDAYLKQVLTSSNAYSLRNYVKVIFERIESNNNPAPVDFGGLSIEHIMPQTPNLDWVKQLRETNNISEDEYKAQVHRIGNLTLAEHTDNSKMSNNSFEYKKEVLSSTQHIKMNKKILDLPKWDIEEIDNRTQEIIEEICKLYPYDTVGDFEQKKYKIFYKLNECNVSALLYEEDGTVEIQMDSQFKSENQNSEINSLLEQEILNQSGKKYIFNDNYSFESLNSATQFITGDSTNSWEVWIDNNGNPLNMDIRPVFEFHLMKKKQY